MDNHLTDLTKTWDLALRRPGESFSACLCLVSAPLSALAALRTEYLGPAERERYDRFPADRRRLSFLSGRLAAKAGICRLHPAAVPSRLDIVAGVLGQPVLQGDGAPGCQVTISHHDSMGGAIAFPEAHPMGLDLELPRPEADATIESQMTAREMELLRQLPLPASTARSLGWSVKESLSKVIKSGLMSPFAIYEIEGIEVTGSEFVSTFVNFGQYKAISVSRGAGVVSIALPKGTELSFD
jgi:4'-phosphopantetheinyl transferase